MLPQRPYLLKAFFDWIVDSQCTPYLVVNARIPNVDVPQEHVSEQGQIVFNISPYLVKDLQITKEAISFKAHFAGIIKDIYVPMEAAIGIYAKENNQGTMFTEEAFPNDNIKPDSSPDFLKIIK
jgi:stringent starvation protein B